MKNTPLLSIILLLSGSLIACSKSNKITPQSTWTEFSFSANNSPVSFTVNMAFIQDVYNTHTILITGQYPDTSSKKGSISIRLIGDTTGRYKWDSLLITYINSAGSMYYNNTGDSSNFVQLDKLDKTANGVVSGSFSAKVANGTDSIRFSNGIFRALYQN